MTAGRTVNPLSHHWGTPSFYVDAVRAVLGIIALDPCSNDHSVVHATTEYRLPEVDGLRASWDYPTIYVNPPYGADRERRTTIRDWLRRCADSHREHGAHVIALVPVATNTSHWKNYIWNAASAVAFLYDTRLKFLVDGRTGGKGAPMSCAMVYWGPNVEKFMEIFSAFGAVVDLRTARVAQHSRAGKRGQLAFVEPATAYAQERLPLGQGTEMELTR